MRNMHSHTHMTARDAFTCAPKFHTYTPEQVMSPMSSISTSHVAVGKKTSWQLKAAGCPISGGVLLYYLLMARASGMRECL